MHFVMAASPFVSVTLILSLVEAKFYRPHQFNQYKAGVSQHYDQGKPTSRHKNHCAYVVEKTVSFTVQHGAAPYVKAEYNKCSLAQKCPTLQYRLMYKPIYKVAHKTVTQLEWRCCPGYSGYGCMEGHPVYQHPMRMMPPFNGPPMKGPQFKGPQFKGPQYKGPMFNGPMFKGPPVVRANPWSQPKGPPTNSFNPYQMRHFGPPSSSSYPETSFEPFPSEQEPEQMPEHLDPHHTEHDQEHGQEHDQEHGQEHEQGHRQEYDQGHGQEHDHRQEYDQGHRQEHEQGHGQEHEQGHRQEYDQGHGQEHEQGHGQEHEQGHRQEYDQGHGQEHEQGHGQEHEQGHGQEHEQEHNLEHDLDHDHSQGPEEHIPEEIPPPPSGGEQPETENIGQSIDSETEERIYRMEEDVRRLNQGLDTLRGTVNGLEDSLRASLREDANRMLSALLSAAPSPVAAQAAASNPPVVGFVEIPGGDPDTEGLDGRHVLPGLTELNRRVEELRTELQSKTTELQNLKTTVKGHDGALKTILNGAGVVSESTGSHATVEKLIEAKLSTARTEILGGFEKRVESAEGRCEEKAGDVKRQCQREQGERQEKIEDSLMKSTTGLRSEMVNLQTQVHGVKDTESCLGRVRGLDERVRLLETSVAGLNQSQGHLRVELGGHKDHIEGMLEGRLGYVEAKLNITGQDKSNRSGRSGTGGQGLEVKMEGKLRAMEDRLLMALEELGNATAPVLLEGHAVPALETELESIRERLEVDVDRVQRQLSSLEILCSSSCSPTQNPSAIQGDSSNLSEQNVKKVLDIQGDRLSRLNVTLQNIMTTLTLRDQQAHAEGDPPVKGQLTILKFNVRSVNHTLKGLQESMGTMVHHMDQANSSWHEREARLAQQIKGVVQLVGHQASMLGSGERKLTRLKGELQEMRRRLAQEVRGCQTTAMGVQKEVTEVGGRVASVEDQCKGLNYLAEDLERIREELDGQSNGLLHQVNGTLNSHTQQLSELKRELRNCTSKVEPTQNTLEVDVELKRGDTFTLH